MYTGGEVDVRAASASFNTDVNDGLDVSAKNLLHVVMEYGAHLSI